MPLKPTMVVAANSMRDGGRPREVKAAGGVMPRGGDGAMLSQSGAGGVIPLGADGDDKMYVTSCVMQLKNMQVEIKGPRCVQIGLMASAVGSRGLSDSAPCVQEHDHKAGCMLACVVLTRGKVWKPGDEDSCGGAPPHTS
jgi:hypothetical protein